MDKKNKNKEEGKTKPKIFGNPEYGASEDIYSHDEKIDSDDLDDDLRPAKGKPKKKLPGDDLDVPGSELDDADEKIGEEDEENNYYSLGGDDHNDLEEEKDE
ncbi:MAG TPA: hypothetical protein VKR53_00360 [Puia sp.]|nr:hypothetical protein [Puia sp.]